MTEAFAETGQLTCGSVTGDTTSGDDRICSRDSMKHYSTSSGNGYGRFVGLGRSVMLAPRDVLSEDESVMTSRMAGVAV